MASQQATSTLFSILADQRRQDALEILRDAELPMPVDVLARAIVAREVGDPEAAIDEKRVDSCIVALYHNHLPRMEAADVLAVDWEQLLVTDAERIAIPTLDGSVS